MNVCHREHCDPQLSTPSPPNYVRCKHCGSSGPPTVDDESAIRAWNAKMDRYNDVIFRHNKS